MGAGVETAAALGLPLLLDVEAAGDLGAAFGAAFAALALDAAGEALLAFAAAGVDRDRGVAGDALDLGVDLPAGEALAAVSLRRIKQNVLFLNNNNK